MNPSFRHLNGERGRGVRDRSTPAVDCVMDTNDERLTRDHEVSASASILLGKRSSLAGGVIKRPQLERRREVLCLVWRVLPGQDWHHLSHARKQVDDGQENVNQFPERNDVWVWSSKLSIDEGNS